MKQASGGVSPSTGDEGREAQLCCYALTATVSLCMQETDGFSILATLKIRGTNRALLHTPANATMHRNMDLESSLP